MFFLMETSYASHSFFVVVAAFCSIGLATVSLGYFFTLRCLAAFCSIGLATVSLGCFFTLGCLGFLCTFSIESVNLGLLVGRKCYALEEVGMLWTSFFTTISC